MQAVLLIAVTVPTLTPAADDAVIRWNEAALQAIRAERTPPPLAARRLAMVHVAIHDAVNATRGGHRAFRVSVEAPPRTSDDLAAAAAAHRVLTELYPARVRQFDSLLARSIETAGDDAAAERAFELGRNIGGQVADWRFDDGSTREVRYTPGREPGDWNPTPPAFAPPLAPHWPKVKCFVLGRGDHLRPDGPPALTSDAYAAAFDEVRRLGAKTGSARTRDQTEIARFWADGDGTVTPPGHWNRIAQSISRQRGLTLAENARMFALLNVALADVGIACWDCKFHFSFWRPIHAIRAADRDGNPGTSPVADWEPLLPTPPFPSYTSGHSSFSAAAATVLAEVLGTDDVRFETTSDGLPGVTRRFTSLWAAAEEAGMSRIYGGIHWQFDNTDGLACGRKVGQYVVEHSMTRR